MGYFTTIPCTHVWSIACQDLFTMRQNLVTNLFLLFSACYGILWQGESTYYFTEDWRT
jgi:hypothetical protein